MITKAIVLGKVEDNPNKYWVRIPIFEGQGNNSNDAELYDRYAASLCYNPGTIDAIRDGDVVYVSFEDNDFSHVVILGNLYLGEESDKAAHQSASSLTVNGAASLNGNVTINGISLDKLAEHNQAINNLNSVTDSLYNKMPEVDLGDWTITVHNNGKNLMFHRKKDGEE